MKEWKEYKIDDIAEPNPKVKLEKGQVYARIEMEDVEPLSRYVKTSKTIVFDGSGGSRFKHGDILFARITPCLENRKIAQASILELEYGIGSTEFFVLRAREGFDRTFLFYLLKTDLVVDIAVNSMVGASGRQRADWNFIKKIKLKLPPLSIQHQIAGVLGKYDDLIANYEQQIYLLEQTAKELYREWFVRGRCPMGNEGWKEISITDICTIGRGSSPRPINDETFFKDGTIPWIKIADVTASGKFLYSTKEYVNEHGASFSRLLPKGSLIIAASGSLGIVSILGVEGCIHDGWIYFTDYKSGISPNFLYLMLYNLTEYLNNMSYGAAIQNINTDILRETPLMLPSIEVTNRFNEIVIPIDESIDILSKQIATLRTTRDKLLPRLLRGDLLATD